MAIDVGDFLPEPIFERERIIADGPFDSILKLATGDLDGNGTTDVVFASRDTDDFGWLANLGGEEFSEPRYLHRNLDEVKTITLSYTFFRAPGDAEEATNNQASAAARPDVTEFN